MRIEKYRLNVWEHKLITNQIKFCERKEKGEVSFIGTNVADDKRVPIDRNFIKLKALPHYQF